MVALIICLVCLPFVPAQGPYVYYGIPVEKSPYLDRFFPWQMGPQITGLRLGGFRDVTASAAGLVSIPSFHAAAGVLFIWASWGWRTLRWPILLLDIAMICTAPVNGAHYLIDLIAGCVLAGGVVLAIGRLSGRSYGPEAVKVCPLDDHAVGDIDQ